MRRSVVQAKSAQRIYVNLRPLPAMDVNRDEIGTLQAFFGEYRLTRPNLRGQLLPNSRFIFVTELSGQIRMHPRYRHAAIAEGNAVLYAGEAEFQHGKLLWWSNASGSYKPDRRDAQQAGLPLDSFITREQHLTGNPRLRQLRTPPR
jgi:hypothetical protein